VKRTTLITLSAAVLAVGACGKKAETSNENAAVNTMGPANSAGETVAPVTQGQTFANTAASSDTFEIETSRLAETNSSSTAVKNFAQSMIKAHTASTEKLKAAAGQASAAITPLPALTATQQQVVDGLKTKTGAAFDAAYKQAQISGHQATLDALKAYSARGDVASLKAFATEMIPVVTGHLNMANGLKG
jgi:putative membrane protein